MAFINGSYYVPGRPADFAIIQFNVSTNQLHSKILPSYRGFCYWCFVDSIRKNIEVTQQDNRTIVRMHVVQDWHEDIESDSGTQTFYYSDNAEFQTSIESPLVYDATKDSIRINEINYNHSLYAEKLIYVNTSDLITRYVIMTSNGSVLHRLQVAQIDYTSKGVPYANYSAFDTWEVNGSNISYQYNAVVLDNVNATYSIQAYSPFGPVNNVTTTVTEKIWTPENAISSFTFLIIFIVSVAFFSISKMR
jgi:hypothetical protein